MTNFPHAYTHLLANIWSIYAANKHRAPLSIRAWPYTHLLRIAFTLRLYLSHRDATRPSPSPIYVYHYKRKSPFYTVISYRASFMYHYEPFIHASRLPLRADTPQRPRVIWHQADLTHEPWFASSSHRLHHSSTKSILGHIFPRYDAKILLGKKTRGITVSKSYFITLSRNIQLHNQLS